jgi:hypothetical protein
LEVQYLTPPTEWFSRKDVDDMGAAGSDGSVSSILAADGPEGSSEVSIRDIHVDPTDIVQALESNDTLKVGASYQFPNHLSRLSKPLEMAYLNGHELLRHAGG